MDGEKRDGEKFFLSTTDVIVFLSKKNSLIVKTLTQATREIFLKL